ncbi:capsular polysaccharide synthesis protein-domain-containing protein [Xylariaceae sp. FL1272]|nr:capsular polysaccharide synthesis protein-domain-containing protein [Xylariaceae sp. FL1272]
MAIKVPPAFQDALEPVETHEKRTDEEIFQSLLEYTPPSESEKNIWAFWDSGFKNMPAWCQRNIVSWVRICGPEWTVRVLDDDPDSPNYAVKYIPQGSTPKLPDRFYDRSLNGEHSGPHTADMLRGACVFKYGGVWMDCSTFLARHMDDLCWNMLSDPASPYQVAVPWQFGLLLNSFIAGRKGDPFLERWHNVFIEIWEGRDNADGLYHHPLLTPIAPYFLTKFQGALKLKFTAPPEKVIEYGAQMVCWERLVMIEKDKTGFSCADYAANNIAWFDFLREGVRPMVTDTMEFNPSMAGQGMVDLLATPVDGDKDSQAYKDAEQMLWTQLTTASMLKIGTIKGMVGWVSASTLWNMPENLGKDATPGTFGELLRTVPAHFKQKRQGITLIPVAKSPVTFRDLDDDSLVLLE